jgi:diguanylate cyclase (GGDEF)-like protein
MQKGAEEMECGKVFWMTVGLVIVGVLGVLDRLTGPEIAFGLFYLIPVSLVAWFAGRAPGVLTAFVSAVVWLFIEMATREPYSHIVILYWNAVTRVGFFLIVAWLLSALKTSLSREKAMARTDYVTGAFNARFFFELAEREMERSRRYKHSFTFAYLDLDDFKIVNDRFGHSTGNRLLRTVTITIIENLRKTDVIARLGGDEFGLLLPETGAEAGRTAISKIRHILLKDMEKNNFPVSFSIGVVTYTVPPAAVDGMVKKADDLMYSVKKAGKNGIAYSVYPGESTLSP